MARLPRHPSAPRRTAAGQLIPAQQPLFVPPAPVRPAAQDERRKTGQVEDNFLPVSATTLRPVPDVLAERAAKRTRVRSSSAARRVCDGTRGMERTEVAFGLRRAGDEVFPLAAATSVRPGGRSRQRALAALMITLVIA